MRPAVSPYQFSFSNQPKDQFFTCSGSLTKICYRIHGESENTAADLYLLAGFGAQLTIWPQHYLNSLVDQGFRVIVIDNHGVGQTVVPQYRLLFSASNGLFDMATDIRQLIEKLSKHRSFYVAGVSMGGMLAQLLASDLNGKISGLVLALTSNQGPGLSSPGLAAYAGLFSGLSAMHLPWLKMHACQMARMLSGTKDEINEELICLQVEEDYERGTSLLGLSYQLKAVASKVSLSSYNQYIDAPCKIIHAEEDVLFAMDHAMSLNKQIQGSELAVIPGAGHIMSPALLTYLKQACCDLLTNAAAAEKAISVE